MGRTPTRRPTCDSIPLTPRLRTEAAIERSTRSEPLQSEILTRIHSADDPMPPRDAEKPLSEAERELLSTWIKQGGEYALHWALVPPQ